MENNPSKKIRLVLPGSSAPVALPGGWSLGSGTGPAVTAVCPEGDLRIAFSISPLEGTPEEIARTAWSIFDNTFDFPVLQKIQMPASAGWDGAFQVIYNLPAAQSRAAVAVLRMLGAKAYCTLILGTTASLSRCMAQIMEVLENWKPEGLREPSLAGTEPKEWGKAQSSEMSGFLRSSIEELQIPGAATAVVRRGRIVFAEGFGLRKIGSREPVRPETRFMLGSSTKPLTTLMMARLVALGKLEWSTPVTKLLPDFALADPDVTRKLEIRHTVSASTGMPRRDMDFIFKFKGITPEQRLAEMKRMKPTTGFGETFQYSNYLVAAGGYAAARSFWQQGSLQDAYEHAMRELVFEPLGMKLTSFDETNGAKSASPHATGFEGKAELLNPVMERCVAAVAPGGAGWSTVTDMAQYLLLELRRGKLPNGQQLLPEDALTERWKRGTKITDKLNYGLGLFRGEEEGLDVIHHGGNTVGFSADMYFLPQEDIGVVLLTNCYLANPFLAAARRRVFELLFDAPPKAEKMIATASLARKEAVAGRLARVKVEGEPLRWLEAIAGEYHCNELGPLTVRGQNRHYEAQFESWSSALGVEAQPDGSRVAVLTSPPWSGGLRLQSVEDGRVLILDHGQNLYRFERR